MRMASSPTKKDSVLAMRAGWVPRAWAASSTVALDSASSRTWPERPKGLRYSFTASTDMERTSFIKVFALAPGLRYTKKRKVTHLTGRHMYGK